MTNTVIALASLISGKALGNAIKANGKAIATHSERQHLLAASALKHLSESGGCEHLQALYEMTPSNYKPALRQWASEFGRCTFKAKDDKGVTVNMFFYAKAKKGNLEGALAISPSEFAKAPAAPRVPGEYDYVATIASMNKRAETILEEFEAKNVPARVIEIMEALKEAIAKAETAAGKFRVNAAKPAVTVVEGGKAKEAPKAPKAAKTEGEKAAA